MATVNEKMTAIADNLRSFTGKNEPLTLGGMAQGVNEVYEAGQTAEYDRFWDNFQNYGNRTNYSYAFGGSGWGAETFKPKYTPIKLTGSNASFLFVNFMRKELTQERVSIDTSIVDLSECTSATSTFMDSTFDSVTVDLGNATALQQTFSMGSGVSNGIRSITLKVTDKCTAFNSTFAYAYNTEEVFFTEDSVIAASISFAQSTLLTYESIKNIMNTLSGEVSGKTATFSRTAVNKAFETVEGARDGSASAEWTGLVAAKPNWTIQLA